jgi:hypothetical protein
MPAMQSNSERALIWFLRLTAITLLPAAIAVVMPHAWMSAVHQWLGLDVLPDMPMIGYLTRSLSALYAFLGTACWFLSRDVRRYAPFLRFMVSISLFFGATLCAIDTLVEMPTLWTLIETLFVLCWTTTLWWLMRSVPA